MSYVVKSTPPFVIRPRKAVRRSCVVFVLQMTIAVGFVLVSLWAASLVLELTPIVGITTVPPGIAFVTYDKRH
jgi:hypothetical protein